MQKKPFERWKNAYQGKRCFIIGNGPSLRMEDLDLLHERNEITFGSNRIYVAFDNTEWRPTFYTIQDGEMIKEYRDEIARMPVKNKFIADYSLEHLFDKKIPGATYFHLDTRRFFPYYPEFSIDVNEQIFEGFTVTYANIQFAVYMGFTEIYLLGVDFNYKHSTTTGSGTGASDYFVSNYVDTNKKRNLPQLDRSYHSYIAAKTYTSMHGIKVMNATRGGKLDVFERVNFDALF